MLPTCGCGVHPCVHGAASYLQTPLCTLLAAPAASPYSSSLCTSISAQRKPTETSKGARLPRRLRKQTLATPGQSRGSHLGGCVFAFSTDPSSIDPARSAGPRRLAHTGATPGLRPPKNKSTQSPNVCDGGGCERTHARTARLLHLAGCARLPSRGLPRGPLAQAARQPCLGPLTPLPGWAPAHKSYTPKTGAAAPSPGAGSPVLLHAALGFRLCLLSPLDNAPHATLKSAAPGPALRLLPSGHEPTSLLSPWGRCPTAPFLRLPRPPPRGACFPAPTHPVLMTAHSPKL
jgi:hypothetical protein